jgi:hypothetical protein
MNNIRTLFVPDHISDNIELRAWILSVTLDEKFRLFQLRNNFGVGVKQQSFVHKSPYETSNWIDNYPDNKVVGIDIERNVTEYNYLSKQWE